MLDPDAPFCDKEIFNLGIPVLGICYGMQLMGLMLGGCVEKGNQREYGKMDVKLINECSLFNGLERDCYAWRNCVARCARKDM